MPAPITLTGRLVRLEPMCEDHLEPLLAAASEDRASFGYTYVPKDRAAVRRYLDVAADDLRAGVAVPFATVELRTGRVVGATRFRDLEYWNAGVWPPRHGRVNPSGVPDAAEIGSTWLVPSAHRTGVNVEAKLLMLRHAFETWRVHRVSFKADTRNERSRAAILALGATFEGVRRAHFPAAEGGVRDSALFSILSSEWQAAKDLIIARLARHGVQPPAALADLATAHLAADGLDPDALAAAGPGPGEPLEQPASAQPAPVAA